MGNRVAMSCAKKFFSKPPHSMTQSCPPGKEQKDGLCYDACKSGYNGIGPVCWGQAPEEWKECGMGASNDDATCAWMIQDQFVSVAAMALSLATLGGSEAAQHMLPSDKAKKMFRQLKANVKSFMKTYPAIDQAVKTRDFLGKQVTIHQLLHTSSAATNEDIVRLSAMVASLFDPSGITGVVAAYTYPTCSKYFPNSNQKPVHTTGDKGLTPWTSEEHEPVHCEGPSLVNSFQCNGPYCDNIRLGCHDLSNLPAVSSAATLARSHWTESFSDEGNAIKLCPENQFMTGLRCEGSYCDDISIRCTEFSSIIRKESGCHMSSRTVSEENGGRLDMQANHFVAGVRCIGPYCDDKMFWVCPYETVAAASKQETEPHSCPCFGNDALDHANVQSCGGSSDNLKTGVKIVMANGNRYTSSTNGVCSANAQYQLAVDFEREDCHEMIINRCRASGRPIPDRFLAFVGMSGQYKREPIENAWHDITISSASQNQALWTIRDGSHAWALSIVDGGKVMTRNDCPCPYGVQEVGVEYDGQGNVAALIFLNQRYARYTRA